MTLLAFEQLSVLSVAIAGQLPTWVLDCCKVAHRPQEINRRARGSYIA